MEDVCEEKLRFNLYSTNAYEILVISNTYNLNYMEVCEFDVKMATSLSK